MMNYGSMNETQVKEDKINSINPMNSINTINSMNSIDSTDSKILNFRIMNSHDMDFKADEFYFKLIDFENLCKNDIYSYKKHTNDYDAIQQVFGSFIASFFHMASYFKEDIGLQEMITYHKKNREIIKNYVAYNWFVYNKDMYCGTIGLRTPNHDVNFGTPGKNTLVLSVAIIQQYIQKAYESSMMRELIKQLFVLFDNLEIIVLTQITNTPVKKLCIINGFTYIARTFVDIDYGIFINNIELDIFILKDKNNIYLE